MTEQEFDNIKWVSVGHFTGGGICETAYRPKDDDKTTLMKYVSVRYDPYYEHYSQGNSKPRTEYVYKDKVYKSKQKLLEVINDENRRTSTKP